ncbi:DJ-1/PfpI family protein [Aneurinibacillus sp. Ricciae_BoGa-3]|uniref:DJ-1/PfpI family protein n=1 Tax=Aneurinibacillus sp. Ricciae_BoGa-3 TaxID=3022697 RepID=UPI0023418642|nr:DJ-1/PfpI family protein [Aneurinibacillus sp. Ricciae_BoGa-3]WCK55235.1 DJ-1/PfpI family protein [Aneurinibacillus sp. Ricciae_BoGa-3]
MKKLLLRLVVYVLSFVVFVGGIGMLGLMRSQNDFYGTVRHEPVPYLQGVHPPKYDATKPTVAVLLANVDTEVFDFMIPYDLFSRTNAFNVFAVAPDHGVKSLSGGLDVVPHYSYKELDKLLGKSPDIIVVPYMPIVDEKKYQPTREWIKQHSSSKTTLLSICGGSGNLADAGLLKGKSAATHWQAIPGISWQYPDTHWEENLRYVHEGNIITSAGQTAGIDAVLYMIAQKLGEPIAAKIAKEINYPSYHFVQNPKVDPFHMDIKFSTYVLNNAFHWNKKQMGVLLYNGMDEISLSSIFDSYADTGTTQVLTVSSSDAPVVTKHHLNIVARHQIANAPKLDKMIVPGGNAKTLAAADVKLWSEKGNANETLLIHSDSPNRYAFEAPLEDLAKQEDLLTAKHAVKRLEYRANHIHLEGKPFPLETYSNMLLTGLLTLLIAFFIDRRFIMKKTIFKSHKQAS